MSGTLIASGIIGSSKPFTRSTGDQVSVLGCAPTSQRQGGVVQVSVKKRGRREMRFSEELVRQFFLRTRHWALPVGLTLLVLGGLVLVTDVPLYAPFTHSSF